MQGNGREGSGNLGPDALKIVDLEVLLDLLRNPALVEKARAVIERAVSKSLLNEVTVNFCCLLTQLLLLMNMRYMKICISACCFTIIRKVNSLSPHFEAASAC